MITCVCMDSVNSQDPILQEKELSKEDIQQNVELQKFGWAVLQKNELINDLKDLIAQLMKFYDLQNQQCTNINSNPVQESELLNNLLKEEKTPKTNLKIAFIKW